MELYDFLKHLNSGAPVYSDSEAFEYMHELSNEAMRITFRLNGSYHTPEEIRALFSQLTGKPVDESFRMFPPFYTDCGKNTTIGKNPIRFMPVSMARWYLPTLPAATAHSPYARAKSDV